MTTEIEIFFNDLTPEKQKEILCGYNISSAQDANLDVFPVTTIEIEYEAEKEVEKNAAWICPGCGKDDETYPVDEEYEETDECIRHMKCNICGTVWDEFIHCEYKGYSNVRLEVKEK